MKKLSKKLKRWNDSRSRKLAVHSKKKRKYSNIGHAYSKKLIAKSNKNKENIFVLPKRFSIIANSNETIKSFNNLFSFITQRRHSQMQVFIDLSTTEFLTIDAIMFLLAIINNLKQQYKINLSFKGNSPKVSEPKRIFTESGFYNYVKCLGKYELDRNEDNIQIVSGTRCDNKLAKRISDFVKNKLNIEIKKLHFLYVMMIELMNNTNKHAYSEKESLLNSKWFCYVRYINNGTIAFSFLDTGIGIPTTIKKRFFERLISLGTIQDHKLLISALNGDFRSQTLQGNRGKGIPKIREYATNGLINNLQIITNRANVKVITDSYTDSLLDEKFMGTLYYWEIDLQNIGGDNIYDNN